jgi:hypothetical protein
MALTFDRGHWPCLDMEQEFAGSKISLRSALQARLQVHPLVWVVPAGGRFSAPTWDRSPAPTPGAASALIQSHSRARRGICAARGTGAYAPSSRSSGRGRDPDHSTRGRQADDPACRNHCAPPSTSENSVVRRHWLFGAVGPRTQVYPSDLLTHILTTHTRGRTFLVPYASPMADPPLSSRPVRRRLVAEDPPGQPAAGSSRTKAWHPVQRWTSSPGGGLGWDGFPPTKSSQSVWRGAQC